MSASSRAISDSHVLDLAALRQMSFEELDRRYRSSPRPATIADLDGDAKGAMLPNVSRAVAHSPHYCAALAALQPFPGRESLFTAREARQVEVLTGSICWGSDDGFRSARVSVLLSSMANLLLFWITPGQAIHH